MSEQAAGWLNDPYGRYQQRYWDGSNWTEHVATNGVQVVDPLGVSPVIPFSTPPTAFDAPPAGSGAVHGFAAAADLSDPNALAPEPHPAKEGNAVTRFLDGMGGDVRLRPHPGFRTALSGIGGLMVAVGVTIAVAGDDPSRGTLIGVSLVVLLAALALRWFVNVAEVQAAAVGMAVVAIPVFSGAATVSDGTSGALTYLLAAVLFLAAWALKGFRGRTVLLGLGLLAMVGVFSTVASDVGKDKCETYIENNDYDSYFDECQDYTGDGGSNSVLPVEITDNVGSQGVVFLICAALLLGGTWWLDRRGYHGAGTGTVVAGLLSAVAGSALLVEDFGDTGGPLMVVVVGVLVCIVGTHGARRSTTWLGAALASAGAAALVAVQWKPDSVGSAGGVAILTGVLLIGAAFIASPIQRAVAQRDANDAPQPTLPFGPPEG
jgi:hypothetical protein